MRPGLIQQAFQQEAEAQGQRPPLVTGSKQALEETQGQTLPQAETLIMNPSPLLKHLAPYIDWNKK